MMLNSQSIFDLDSLLRVLSDKIDVGSEKYSDAENRYKAVANWLEGEDSQLNKYRLDIFVQGSFSLGTATKPYGEDGEFDIDAMCVLRQTNIPGNENASSDQRQWVKNIVGTRLKESGIYGPMLEPKNGKRRCWTIEYSDASKFHLDVCPAIEEDAEIIKIAGLYSENTNNNPNYILLTDNKNWNEWINGNPRGYRIWFMQQMRERLDKQLTKIAASKFADVEDVPEYEARTTLQRAIQILKRHRDIKYEDDDDAPISIIITTLAAKAYNNDPNLFTTLQTIIDGMRTHVEFVAGKYYVKNPVDSRENFADKWEKKPRKKDLFFDWLDSLDALFEDLPNLNSELNIKRLLKESFGSRDSIEAVNEFVSGLSPSQRQLLKSGAGKTLYPPVLIPPSDHAKRPKWTKDSSNYTATIRCVIPNWNGFRKGRPIKSDQPLSIGRTLNFDVSTSVPTPYEVYWQVTNTGQDALNNNCLRGDFYDSSIKLGAKKRVESTSYIGRHWVKVFIVKNGQSYTESEEFIVNIQQKY